MISLIYILGVLLALLPWTWLAKIYADKIKLRETLKEINELKAKIAELPPSKEKRRRILKLRYEKLRKRVSNFFMINLIILWGALFMGIVIGRYFVLAYADFFNIPPYIPSPISIPYITQDGHLSDLTLFFAVILVYQALHNKVTGVSLLQTGGQ